MKSFKLFAALAMPIVFAACTSEELYTNEINAPQKMEEVVGTKLLGTDLSLNFSVGGDAESRLTTGGSWQRTDLLGLGWLTNNDNPFIEQTAGPVNSSKLYNNPMFAWNEDKGMFTASGNMYQGWYFGYYPWSYMEKPGTLKTVTVNPKQVSSNPNDRMSQLLHLSHRQYVSAAEEGGDIDRKTGTINKTFQAFPVLNVLAVKTTAKEGSKFEKENGVLAGCNIESVTISTTGKNVFQEEEELIIYAARIPEYNSKKSKEENQEALEAKLVGGELPIFGTKLTNTVTTEVAEGVYTVGDNASIYTLLVPATADLKEEKVTIEVKIDCGRFVIEHTGAEEEPESPEAINNMAIDNIKAYFGKDGALTSIAKNDEGGLAVQRVEVILTEEDFYPDFTIEDAEDWNKTVQLVNNLELSLEDTKFELANNVEITLPGTGKNKINLPTNGVIVKGTKNNKLKVDGKYSWNENLKLIENNNLTVEVTENGTLTINSGVQLTNKVTNNGQITVKGMTKTKNGATLGAKTGNLVNNGVVYVEYGAFVYPTDATKANSIVYKLPKNYNFGYIKDMTTAGAVGSANVNTLEINSDIELNCKKTIVSGGEAPNGNPYNPTPGSDPTSDEDILSLEGLNLWINGTGKVSATAPYAYKVKDVVMNGGELSGIGIAGDATLDGTTSISNGDIAGNVTVKGGEATISNGDIASGVTVEAGSIEISNGDVTGNVTIAGTANISNGEITNNVTLLSGESNFTDVSIYGTLEIKAGATINMSKETGAIKVKNIINSGKLTSKNDVNVETVHLNNSITHLESAENARDKVMWYSVENGYVQGENTGNEIRGRILHVSATAFNEALTSVKKGETIVLNQDLEIGEWADLKNDVAYILDLNGNSLTVTNWNALNSTALVTIKNGKIKSPLYTNANFKAENVVFEIDGKVDSAYGCLSIAGIAKVELTDCKFECINYQPLNVESGFNGSLTLTDCTFEYKTLNCFPYFNPVGNKANILVVGCVFESPLATDISTCYSRFKFENNKFNETFDYTGKVSVENIPAKEKTFINDVLGNNDFVGTNKVAWWFGSSPDYINASL